MARTRQKAKQRKAKRLEQERKAAERTSGRVEPVVEPTDEPVDSGDAGSSTAEALAEIEQAQVRAAQELEEGAKVEVGAGAEAAHAAAAVEAAAAAEIATTGPPQPAPEQDAGPAKPRWRDRRRDREAEPPKPSRVERKRETKPAPKAARKREPRARGRVVNFLRQVWAELRRVQWPDRAQTTQATAVTIVFCFVAGAYLGIWDFLFGKLIKAIL
jgi:preprotein translocase subunit SecE